MDSTVIGWDLLYATVKADIKTNQDVLVCFTHLVLINNGFKCIGLGDSKNLDGTEIKSELLPEHWNDNTGLRYVHNGRLYNFRVTNMDDAVMINILRVQERVVSMVQLNVNAVAERAGSLEKVIPNYESLAQTIKKQLIDKVIISTKYRDVPSQTTEQSGSIYVENPHPLSPEWIPSRRSDPFGRVGVGRSDLDPVGVFPPIHPAVPIGGGGMLFVPPRAPLHNDDDPLHPNFGIAPGSLPPGARFDPFRPPNADPMPRRPNRPGSEFPPPGFDDMYM